MSTVDRSTDVIVFLDVARAKFVVGVRPKGKQRQKSNAVLSPLPPYLLPEMGKRYGATSASSGSFDCVWREVPRQTPLRMTDFFNPLQQEKFALHKNRNAIYELLYASPGFRRRTWW
jgi:hypothetical protein